MLDWVPVTESSLVAACAYDEAAERIFVQFHSGTVWQFENCSREMWRPLTIPGTSKGRYVQDVLSRQVHHAVG
ncbi:KTSC domain-containing protein [Streptomyces sp. NPDC046557]|uniref:KTSC domain-containing protein n=1 Tax=Streptomyces sp. NPDC046557 TaxID=3155372 RepID=UPI0033CFBA64